MARSFFTVLWVISSLAQGAESSEERMEVRGVSQKKVLELSSRDVVVIETKDVKTQAADTGEVLARTQGVSVRRAGGLGSEERFSLNGLSDDRIRFFIDGVPLSLAGYDFGLANVPLNFMKRIEIYRGVVPVQFGADALGGAINLVTDSVGRGNHWTTSLLVGSFDTIRWTWGGQMRTEDGWIVRGSGFQDYAGNNYRVTARVAEDNGRSELKEVERFHDRYRARGFGVELGAAQKSWAEELILKVFHSESHKELQSDAVLSVPYGEVTRGGQADVISLRYTQPWADSLRFESVTGYTKNLVTLRDLGLCIYSWYGQCKTPLSKSGELGRGPQDMEETYQTLYSRLNLDWTLDELQRLRTSLALTQGQREGQNKAHADPIAIDRLTQKRELLTAVLGAEHEIKLFDDRLENTAFAKIYQQDLSTEKSRLASDKFQNERSTHKTGWGDSLGFDIGGGFHGKLSFERAIRLPNSEEIFGDGVLILSNMDLIPETSTNINAGLRYLSPGSDFGQFEIGLGGFHRDTQDMILFLTGAEQVSVYVNLSNARSQGLESHLYWESPASNYRYSLNATVMDNRNKSKDGPYGDHYGARISNQPYIFANSSLSGRWSEIWSGTIEASLHTRYTAAYPRVWESLPNRDNANTIPEALSHSTHIGYSQKLETLSYSFNFEVQNLTDQKVFDVYGLQRPGRAYSIKTTLDL